MRLPPNTNDEVDEDPTGNKALWDRGLLNGASQKVILHGKHMAIVGTESAAFLCSPLQCRPGDVLAVLLLHIYHAVGERLALLLGAKLSF